MARRWSRTGAALLAFVFSPQTFAADDRDDDRLDDDPVAESQPVSAIAPDAVRREVARVWPNAAVVESAVERSPEGDAWRLRLKDGLAVREVVMDPGGGVLAEAEDVATKQVPWSVRQVIDRQFGSRTLWRARRFSGAGEEAWLVTFSRGDRVGEALVDGDGRLVRGVLG